MDAGIVTVIVVLAVILLAATAMMDWVAVASLLTSRSSPRHSGCGHVRATRLAGGDLCLRCRHTRLDHALEAAEHPLHH